jgi:hypothetical protein
MVNHAFLHSKKRLKPGVLFAHFCASLSVIQNRFVGINMNFEIEPEGATVTIISPDTYEKLGEFSYWNNNKKIEWRHQRGDINWWFAETISSLVAQDIAKTHQLELYLTDEGLGNEKLGIDFAVEYPTLKTWVKRNKFSFLYFAENLFKGQPILKKMIW